MRRMAVGFEVPRSGSGTGAALLRAPLEGLGLLRARVAARRLARWTVRATAGLEPRLREDVGLGPRSGTAPAVPPMTDAWMH